MKTFFTVCSMMIVFGLAAQDIGVGQFKIGKTHISVIDKIADSLKIKACTYNKWVAFNEQAVKYLDKTKSILELTIDTLDRSSMDPKASYCAKTFFINYYQISSIPIRSIYLTFYNDTLISFICKPDYDFIKAFSLKYGAAKMSSIKKMISCKNKYGLTTNYEENTVSYQWTLQKNINCLCIALKYYSDDCKEKYDAEFYLKDEIKMLEVVKKDKEINDKADFIKEQLAKDKLKDF